MKAKSSRRNLSSGFSLLEVLVAVVILTVGLLALATLQLGLIRSSAETKSQTAAMALAKEKLETLAAYQAIGGSSTTCISPSAGTVNTCYRAITTEGPVVISGIGGVDYTRETTVTRYVYDKAAGAYVSRANTALDSAITAASSTSLIGKEFKRVAVSVSWPDASGVTRQIGVEGALSGIEPADTMSVSSVTSLGAPRRAVAIIVNPDSIAGVIPIAIGNGTDTAATNPRPIVVSQGSNMTTVETRFDIYTYAALTGTTATAQSRVETAVVGCKCRFGAGTQVAYRPTYWNGFIYKVPEETSGVPVSAPASGETQSDLCTSCCRDHQDPVGVAAPKFDPRRATHNHYLNTNLASVVSGSGNAYSEACRLIRVDGVFRVAAEPYDDQYGLLATVGLAASTATTTVANAVPGEGTGSVTNLYQTYVINYLNTRFISGTSYNTQLDPTAVTGYSALQTPAPAYIDADTSPQYMHSRGLYIDHLHTDAIAAITSAKADCVALGCTSTELQTAILKLLPFTSVNTTELAQWESTNSSKVGISLLQDFSESINASLPVSGKATYNSGASPDDITADTTMQGSSAGLAITDKIFPDSEFANNAMTDAQIFEIGAGGSGSGTFPGGEIFALSVPVLAADNVTVANADFLAAVLPGNPMQVTIVTPLKSCTPSVSTMTPYSCETNTMFGLGGSLDIKLYNYNRSASKTVQNSCTRPNPTSNASDTTSMPYVINFDVQSTTTVDGAAVTVGAPQSPNLPGISGEYTILTANPVNVGSQIKVYFSNKNYKCPANWATFLDTSGDDGAMAPDNGNTSTVCIGSGSNKVPAWDTTSSFVDCWAGFTP